MMELEEAKKLVAEEKTARKQKCLSEIQAILEEYNCKLDVSLSFKGDVVVKTIVLIAS